jgi:hypothetical protein
MALTYDQIQARLEAIEDDLGHRQAEFEQAAGDYHRAVRDYELRLARTKLTARGDTETAKKDRALDAIAAADDGLYERLTDAEQRYEALKAAIRVLEQRAMIGMSLLKQFSREGAGSASGPQPEWSRQPVAA